MLIDRGLPQALSPRVVICRFLRDPYEHLLLPGITPGVWFIMVGSGPIPDHAASVPEAIGSLHMQPWPHGLHGIHHSLRARQEATAPYHIGPPHGTPHQLNNPDETQRFPVLA